MTFFKNGVSYPLAGRDEMVRHMPHLRGRYVSYADFGASRIQDVFSPAELRRAQVREAYVFASSVALNKGDGSFDLQPLPAEAQFSPVYSVLAEDFDGDGLSDIVIAGNFHGVKPVRGRYTASYGLLLRGDGAGRFESIDMMASNLVIEGEVRVMRWLRHAGGDRLIVAARNVTACRC